jgi:hypothetical protein
MELLEAVHANLDATGLRAQFDQAMQELVVVSAKLRALEAQWGFGAWAPPLAAP